MEVLVGQLLASLLSLPHLKKETRFELLEGTGKPSKAWKCMLPYHCVWGTPAGAHLPLYLSGVRHSSANNTLLLLGGASFLLGTNFQSLQKVSVAVPWRRM